MSILAAFTVLGGAGLVAWLASRLPEPQRREAPARRDAEWEWHHGAPSETVLPQRMPGAALDETAREEARRGHLDAVWAQCLASGPYVAAMLAGHEAEVTDLLELALELDDQAPNTASPYED